MLEGGGKTPILLPGDLEDIGFKLVAYPLSLLGVSIGAMESALVTLKSGRIPQMPSFTHIQKVVGFPEYYEEQDKYKADQKSQDPSTGFGSTEDTSPDRPEVVEPDEIVEPSRESNSESSMPTDEDEKNVDPNTDTSPNGDRGSARKGAAAKNIRLCIKDIKTNATVLDSRFPTAFMNRIANFIPDENDLDIEDLIRSAMKDDWDPTKPILSIPIDDTIIEVYLE